MGLTLDPQGDRIDVLTPEEVLGIGAGENILVVDDQATNLVAYEAALESLGRAIVTASSGPDALAILAKQDFALLLLDVGMPGMNGFELARAIRDQPRHRSTPLLFITGMTPTTELVLEGYAVGALDFLAKPVLPEVLRAKASAYLRLQERTRAVLRRRSEQDASATLRLAKLQETIATLARSDSRTEIASAMVRLGADAVGASSAIVWLAEPDGTLVVHGAHGIPAEYLDEWRTIPPTSHLRVQRVLQDGEAIWVEDEADFEREVPQVVEHARRANRMRAFATLPLAGTGRGVGVMTISYDGAHRFTDDERSFLISLAHTCEQALERTRLREIEIENRRSAEATSRRKDELLAMLGHELRNPLSVIVSAVDLMKMREQSPSRELVMLERQVTYLSRMVGDLVDVSRVTRGRIALRLESVDLADAIAQAAESARGIVERRGHQVVVQAPALVYVSADRHRLVQVLTNLLLNAAQYTDDGGTIELRADLDGDHVRVVVRDNGRGISPELLPNIFDVFVQGERTPDRRDGGLGIGLTMVRTLVQLHGGTVEAHSDGPGTGATFTVRWPRVL